MIIKGWTDEITTCTCCGKQNLKRTCAVENDEGGMEYYGSVCIGAVFGKKAGKEMIVRADAVSRIKAAADPVKFAARVFAWDVSKGWIVDGIGRRVLQVS
jgi:hypothetical protein